MRLLIYAGPSPARSQVLAYAAPLVRGVASELVLITGGGESLAPSLTEAAQRLKPPAGLPQRSQTYAGDAIDALMQAAEEYEPDLVIIGKLQPRLQRLLRGKRGKLLAQRLDPAVLRVQGRSGPIRRILLASGGDAGTLANARSAALIAAPLGASVTILHVVSQQSLVFEGFDRPPRRAAEFLDSPAPEAGVLRRAAALLREQGVTHKVLGRTGSVLAVVAAEARNHDLLVIGAHRDGSPLDRILLENLAGDLLDLSPVPVLVGKA